MRLPFAPTLARSAAAAFALWLGAGLLAPSAAEAIEIKQVTSPGGLHAFLVEDYTNPLIAINFAFRGAGTTGDPAGKEGTGYLLSSLLDEGAGDIPSAAFQARIDDLGMSLSYEAEYDAFTGSFRTIVETEDDAFDLLRLSVTEPRLDAEPVERMRAQLGASLVAEENEPNTLADRAWRASVFPGHPYARPSHGTPDTLKGVTRDDLRAFRRGFAKDNLVIGVVGAIDPAALGRRLDAVFGALPAKAALSPVADARPVLGGTAAVTLDVPQTTIQFVLPGVMRADKDFFAAYLMNHILGGGSFSSRLYQEVREKRGLAYGASSYIAPFDHASILGISTATRADKAAESIGIIRGELKRMAEEGPSEAELARAKAFLKGSYAVQNLDSSLAIASTLASIQLDNLGIDYIDRRQGLIEAVTLDDVKRMARALLASPPTVVTVGPAGA